MSRNCCIKDCPASQGKIKMSLFSFPNEDSDVYHNWIITTMSRLKDKRNLDFKSLSICERHFEKDCFIRTKTRKILMQDVMPTIFPIVEAASVTKANVQKKAAVNSSLTHTRSVKHTPAYRLNLPPNWYKVETCEGTLYCFGTENERSCLIRHDMTVEIRAMGLKAAYPVVKELSDADDQALSALLNQISTARLCLGPKGYHNCKVVLFTSNNPRCVRCPPCQKERLIILKREKRAEERKDLLKKRFKHLRRSHARKLKEFGSLKERLEGSNKSLKQFADISSVLSCVICHDCDQTLRFFHVPSDMHRLNEWSEKLNFEIKPSAVVCEKHFLEEHFTKNLDLNCWRINSKAIPTLHLSGGEVEDIKFMNKFDFDGNIEKYQKGRFPNAVISCLWCDDCFDTPDLWDILKHLKKNHHYEIETYFDLELDETDKSLSLCDSEDSDDYIKEYTSESDDMSKDDIEDYNDEENNIDEEDIIKTEIVVEKDIEVYDAGDIIEEDTIKSEIVVEKSIEAYDADTIATKAMANDNTEEYDNVDIIEENTMESEAMVNECIEVDDEFDMETDTVNETNSIQFSENDEGNENDYDDDVMDDGRTTNFEFEDCNLEEDFAGDAHTEIEGDGNIDEIFKEPLAINMETSDPSFIFEIIYILKSIPELWFINYYKSKEYETGLKDFHQQFLENYKISLTPTELHENLIEIRDWYMKIYETGTFDQLNYPQSEYFWKLTTFLPDLPDGKTCELCGLVFYDHIQLFGHKRLEHSEENQTSNDDNDYYSAVEYLKKHSRDYFYARYPLGQGGFSYQCQNCPSKFHQRFGKKHFFEHIKMHLDIRDHICDICGKSFVKRTHFEVHQSRHLGTYKCECKICGKNFTNGSLLTSHRKRYHRPIEGTIEQIEAMTKKRKQKSTFGQCTAEGISVSILKDGSRIYSCLLCDKKCTASSSIFGHRTRVHPEIIPKRKGRTGQKSKIKRGKLETNK